MENILIVCDCQKSKNDNITEKIDLKRLNSKYSKILIIKDICGMAANKNKLVLNNLTYKNISVISCQKRALKNILKFGGVDTVNISIEIINQNDSQEMKQFTEFFQEFYSEKTPEKIENNEDWLSWYPVIDYERCTACGQCADFCLFGVYEKHNNKVIVINPKQCKTNCPACARICPHTAIIFPKYKEGGAISGSDNFDELAEKQRIEKDINTILGDDIYKTLEMRKQKRKSIIKQEELQKAIEERNNALNNKKQ